MANNEHFPRKKAATTSKEPINAISGNSTALHTDKAFSHPATYEVWLLNDDYTPMDFVVFVLEKVFHQHYDEAHAIMMRVHTEGQASCGYFTREVAETKVMQVIDFARANEYPLKCIMRKSHEYVIKKS